ncbi:MAG TPA: DUF896 domain-containing protein [Eubacteriaceae bacterium]|nr:DUF896 domain-containing protein [Eubacteriaceae bacterium]
MIERKKLDRINFLAKKAKDERLTPEEKIEQDELRREYLENFRKSFRSQLDNIEFIDDK